MTTQSQLLKMLNEALKLEHAAALQYLAHAELISGLDSGPIIEQLKDTAKDEQGHAEVLRGLIGDYLQAEPTMDIAPTHKAAGISDILQTNIADEKNAVDVYKKILVAIYALKASNTPELNYIYWTFEHAIRHIIMEEEQHIAELTKLLGF